MSKRTGSGLRVDGAYVTFEIVRCVNAAACNQRPLLITVGEDSRRLTGSCDGPYMTVKAYRVRRADLMAALGVPPPTVGDSA